MPRRSQTSTQPKAPAKSPPADILEASVESVEHHLDQALHHLQAAKKLYAKLEKEIKAASKPPRKTSTAARGTAAT